MTFLEISAPLSSIFCRQSAWKLRDVIWLSFPGCPDELLLARYKLPKGVQGRHVNEHEIMNHMGKAEASIRSQWGRQTHSIAKRLHREQEGVKGCLRDEQRVPDVRADEEYERQVPQHLVRP